MRRPPPWAPRGAEGEGEVAGGEGAGPRERRAARGWVPRVTSRRAPPLPRRWPVAGKLCAHYEATLYPYPEEAAAREAALLRLQLQLGEMHAVLQTTVAVRAGALRYVAQQWAYWRYTVSRESALLRTLNLLSFDRYRGVFVGEGWVPSHQLPDVMAALRRATERTAAGFKWPLPCPTTPPHRPPWTV